MSGQRKTFLDVLTSCGESTTVKGVPRIIKSKSLFLKLLWGAAVCFGGCLAVYQLTVILVNFNSHPTVTKVIENHVASVFPDVTLCYLNAFSVFDYISVDPELYANTLMRFILPNKGDDEFLSYFRSMIPDMNLTYIELTRVSDALFSTFGYYQSLPAPPESLHNWTARFLQDCFFYDWKWEELSLTCDPSTVKPFYTPDNFLCFTLSVPPEYKESIMGVSIVGYLSRSSRPMVPVYRTSLFHSKAEAARLLIHPRGSLPLPKNGDNISPGKETTLRLSPVHIQLLPQPHGNCTGRQYLEDEDIVDHKSAVLNLNRYTYTSEGCGHLCRQRAVIKQCACLNPMHRYTEKLAREYPGMLLCGNCSFIQRSGGDEFTMNVTLELISACVSRMLCTLRTLYTTHDSHCQCQTECDTYKYEMTISQSNWPLKEYLIGFTERYIMKKGLANEFPAYARLAMQVYSELIDSKTVMDRLEQMDQLERSFFQVNTLFKEKSIKEVMEKAVMTWDILLATIGGTLNLWIGITFMTLIEIAELTSKLVCYCAGKGQQRLPVTRESEGTSSGGPHRGSKLRHVVVKPRQPRVASIVITE